MPKSLYIPKICSTFAAAKVEKHSKSFIMKRIFVALIFAIAGIVGVQAQNETEAAFVKGFVQNVEERMSYLNGNSLRYNNTYVDGKDIICNVTMDEAVYGNVPLKQAFMILGLNENTFGEAMTQELFKQKMTAEEKDGFRTLKGYGYKIYLRVTGSGSHDTMNCPINYESYFK